MRDREGVEVRDRDGVEVRDREGGIGEGQGRG